MKTTLLLLSVFLSANLFCQNMVYVPDDVLEYELQQLIQGDDVIDDYVPLAEIPYLALINPAPISDFTGLDELKVKQLSILDPQGTTLDFSNWGQADFPNQSNQGTLMAYGFGVTLGIQGGNVESIILPQDTIVFQLGYMDYLKEIQFQNNNVIRNFNISYFGAISGGISELDLSNTIGFHNEALFMSPGASFTIDGPVGCVLLDNGTGQCEDLLLPGIVYSDLNFPICVQVGNPTVMNTVLTTTPNVNIANNCPNCTSSLTELTTSKNLIQILDMMGRETTFKPNTPLIYVYDDGTSQKVFTIE